MDFIKEKTLRVLQELSLRNKLILTYMLVSLLPLSLQNYISFRLANTIITDIAKSSIELLMDRAEDDLNNLFNETRELATSISRNPIIQKATTESFFSDETIRDLNREAGKELLKLPDYRTYIKGIYVIGENETVFSSHNRKLKDEIFRNKYWYKGILQSALPPVIIAPHGESHVESSVTERLLSVGIPLKNLRSDTHMGIVLIELKEESIKNLLSFRLENLGYLFLQYSRTGFTSSRDQIPDSRYLTLLAKNQDISEELLNANNEMVLLRPLETKGLKLAGIINLKKLTRESVGMGLIMLAAMSISLAISFLSAFALSSSIVKPVKKMQELMSRARKGDLSVQMDIRQNDEIGQLSLSFNDMILQINGLMNDVYEDQIKLRKAELETLQAQINPHFLYNTLDSINWLAREGKNAEVDRMVTALTILFRKGISRGKDVIPLEDELEHVRNYLVIQKIRYGNQFSYEMDLPDKDLSSYRALKLILQPLVENAIYHGIKQMKSKGFIHIRCRITASGIMFEIHDNGPGMNEQNLEKLRNALYEREGETVATYGLHNVQKRITIYYGNEYGLKLHSSEGEGFTSYLTIPLLVDETGPKEDEHA